MLSVVAIAKNELKNLHGFLASWSAIADEIVILDTGSTDGTWEELVRIEAQNDKLRAHRTRWQNDFSIARNQAAAFAAGKWIFWADLDDRLDTASIGRLKEIAKLNPTAAYEFQVASDVGANRWSRFMQLRLFPNLPSMQFSGAVHESLNEAIKSIGIPVLREPEIIVAHLGYADVSVKKVKAIRNLEILLQKDPESADALAQIGDSLYVLEKYAVGLGYYETACRANPDARINLAEKLIIGYLSTGMTHKAEVILSELPSRSITRLYWLGELRRMQGQKGEAREYYVDAINHGERELDMRQCNGDALISFAKDRLKELEAPCVLA